MKELKSELEQVFNNNRILIGNGSNYFWVTKTEFFDSDTESNFNHIFCSLGFEIVDKARNERLLVFKIDVTNDELYKTTIFSDGTGRLFRHQFRQDNWGETVHSETLEPGVSEALMKETKSGIDVKVGILDNLPNIGNFFEYEYNFLIKSFSNFRNFW